MIGEMNLDKKIVECLDSVRNKKPLVHNITNFVVMNTTANALLAIGASPIMAHAKEELDELIKIADSIVINIGTLDKYWIESMKYAGRLASEYGKKLVLDPVGAGATRLRTETAKDIIENSAISVLRGNYGEISALAGEHGKTRGVDTLEYSLENAKKIAKKILDEYKKVDVVVITGPTDIVANRKYIAECSNGTPLLEKVTGTGCILSAIIGAYIGVNDTFIGSIAAISHLNVAAEYAEKKTTNPGSFYVELIDQLYSIDNKELLNKVKVNISLVK